MGQNSCMVVSIVTAVWKVFMLDMHVHGLMSASAGPYLSTFLIMCQNAKSQRRDSLQHHTKSVVVSVPATLSFSVNLDTSCDKWPWWFKKREYKHACYTVALHEVELLLLVCPN